MTKKARFYLPWMFFWLTQPVSGRQPPTRQFVNIGPYKLKGYEFSSSLMFFGLFLF